MKVLNQTYTWHCTLLVVAALAITSCASTGMQRSQDTRITMETMDNDIQEASRQLDVTGTSLNELIRPGQTDVKKAFNIYTQNAEEMVAMEKRFAKHAEQMEAKGINYFEEWQKEGDKYENERIQQLSEQRRNALKEIYDKIAENSIGVDEAFKEYATDIKEIQTFLSNDLSTKGIEAIRPTAKEAIMDGESLKYELQKLQTAIQDARAEMSLTGTN